MSELVKTRAIVLRKIDYGDSSRIAQFFTEDFGKISAIIKGARTGKSKSGLAIDTFNNVQIVLYKKESRDVQLISEVELIKHYQNIGEDLDRIAFANGIIELLANLTVENENNHKLYLGSAKALSLINDLNRSARLVFAKFLVFFIKEIGYEFQVHKCSICARDISKDITASLNYDSGIICKECSKDRLVHIELNKELFNLLFCLSDKKNDIQYEKGNLNKIIRILEKFLKYNIHEFKGLKSLEIV
ncbi:MAG: DNA repair protein RecO [Bacteroidota bacterium]